MIQTPDITRPPKKIVEGLKRIGSATASGELRGMGIRDSQIRGPVGWTPGVTIAGPALTLQFMPLREDQYSEDEYSDPEKQLHRHVLYHTQAGDIVVVDARGDMASGVFGEMMLTYFKGRGGQGVVIDGCIRDYPRAKELGLGLWIKGVTPNYHTQNGHFSFRGQRARGLRRAPGHAGGYHCGGRRRGGGGACPVGPGLARPRQRARGVGRLFADEARAGRRPAQILSLDGRGQGRVRSLA